MMCLQLNFQPLTLEINLYFHKNIHIKAFHYRLTQIMKYFAIIFVKKGKKISCQMSVCDFLSVTHFLGYTG